MPGGGGGGSSGGAPVIAPADLVCGLQRSPKYLPCRQAVGSPALGSGQTRLTCAMQGCTWTHCCPPAALHRPAPCRFLYDERGSQLYEEITSLPEYYPYEAGGCCKFAGVRVAAAMKDGQQVWRASCYLRLPATAGWIAQLRHLAAQPKPSLTFLLPSAEKRLLAQHAPAIASQFPAGSVVVELGCGDSTKTALLLRALVDRWAGQGWARPTEEDKHLTGLRLAGVNTAGPKAASAATPESAL